MRTDGCAPVAEFTLAVRDGSVLGYAAPAGGRQPCLLGLEAGSEPVAIARATRFSARAAARGLRLGWCGVTLDMLDAAGHDRVTVRCLVSGKRLVEAAMPVAAPLAAPLPLSVIELVGHARRDDACEDVATILPFAEATLHRHGIAALLEATYRSLQGRAADHAVIAAWEAQPPPEPARAALAMMLTSAEYASRPLRFVPGPFHPGFAFDLSPLEG